MRSGLNSFFLKDVKILESGYRTNFRRVISKALFIKEFKPDLNVQKEAHRLAIQLRGEVTSDNFAGGFDAINVNVAVSLHITALYLCTN